MSQVFQKTYDCLGGCGSQIRLSKIEGAGPNSKKKWNKFELDGVTPHVCKKKEQEAAAAPEPEPTKATEAEQPTLADIYDTLAEIKGYQKVLLTQIQQLKQELVKAKT